ncbi:fasciclin domain-containing protein [Haloferula sp. BvORR071]|uniref:fasciclin domain-containing protein n=1 Tax=Haloferula sp. BvORR071 TaxID=1396141 RepID=UPI0022410017|nr:fasciclin domain-containing protein [Haloferula sp. BvORR071]
MKTTCTLAIIATLAGGTIFDSAAETPMRSKDLPATIAAEPGLTTFTRLVKAAGLEATLHRSGPYTILAPNDDAFRMLPAGTLEKLLKPSNKQRLADLIAYHIVPGDFPSAKIDTEEHATLQGSKLVLNHALGTIWVGRAEVIKKDVESGNGTVHIINMVLEPDRE